MPDGGSIQPEQDSEAKPSRVRSFALYGQVVMTEPNATNPELLDALVLWTEIRLAGLEPKTAVDVIGHAIKVAHLVPRQGLG